MRCRNVGRAVSATAKVPLLDLTRLDSAEADGLRAAFERVLKSGVYIMGPELEAMEREFTAAIGCRHALGLSSGTDALLLALMALGIGPGDEVVCPTFTFFATAGTVWRLGARPAFTDVDPRTYNCTPEQVAAAITPRTKAIMPVHLFGQCADMTGILRVAAARRIPVVEDAAQAIGARHQGRQAGAMGTFGCFSFFPSKNLGCLGDAGLLTTDDDALAEQSRVLRVHGGKPKYHHKVVGGNFRMDALQAALLRVRLPRLPAMTATRRENALRYLELFQEARVASDSPVDVPAGRIGLPAIGPDHTVNQFTIRVGGGRRDALRDALVQQGIGCEIYYPIPLHLQECFRELGLQKGAFPHSERASQEVLSLPVFPGLRLDEQRRVVAAVAAFCQR
jgi:dTDP-4-amino-4,6-dideoxygalactose transaminase